MNKRTQKASGQTFIGFMRKTNARQKSLNYKSVSETTFLSDHFFPSRILKQLPPDKM
jgi:hypothetical protein